MIIPKTCNMLGTSFHKRCDICPFCPEAQEWKIPEQWTAWKWCKDWLEANMKQLIMFKEG